LWFHSNFFTRSAVPPPRLLLARACRATRSRILPRTTTSSLLPPTFLNLTAPLPLVWTVGSSFSPRCAVLRVPLLESHQVFCRAPLVASNSRQRHAPSRPRRCVCVVPMSIFSLSCFRTRSPHQRAHQRLPPPSLRLLLPRLRLQSQSISQEIDRQDQSPCDEDKVYRCQDEIRLFNVVFPRALAYPFQAVVGKKVVQAPAKKVRFYVSCIVLLFILL
jgi:hypothetical protein